MFLPKQRFIQTVPPFNSQGEGYHVVSVVTIWDPWWYYPITCVDRTIESSDVCTHVSNISCKQSVLMLYYFKLRYVRDIDCYWPFLSSKSQYVYQKYRDTRNVFRSCKKYIQIWVSDSCKFLLTHNLRNKTTICEDTKIDFTLNANLNNNSECP